MEDLKRYCVALPSPALAEYAKNSLTTVGYLRRLSYPGKAEPRKKIGLDLALRLDLNSGGAVSATVLRPDCAELLERFYRERYASE